MPLFACFVWAILSVGTAIDRENALLRWQHFRRTGLVLVEGVAVLKNWISSYAQTVVRYRWAVLLMTLLVTGLLAARVTTLKLDNDPDLWAPQDHEFIKTTHELEKLFGGRNFTVVGIAAKNGDIYNPRILAKIRNIQAGIESLPEAVKSNIVSLAAKRVKDIQGTADGMVVRQMLDPMPQTPAQIAQLKAAIARNPIYMNALVSPDGKEAAVIADFRIPPENAAYAPLYAKIRAIADKEKDATVDIQLGGQPVWAANFEFAMQKMPMYFGAAFLIIMAVQLFAFRSVQGMLLPMVTAILSVIWGLGVMALLGIHMDALNTTTPILIMAVATGHSVQILKRYYEELGRIIHEGIVTDKYAAGRLAVAESLAKVGPVMLTAGLVASIAFFSLLVSDVAMIRHFAVFAGSGVLSALIVEFTFIPSLRAILPAKMKQRVEGDTAVDHLMTLIGSWFSRPGASFAILAIAGVLIAVSVVGALRVQADNSVKQYSSPDSLARRDNAELNTHFGGTDSIFFLVDSNKLDGIKDPAVLQGMSKLQAFLDSQPYVGKTQSLADLIKRMNQAMHGDDKAYNVVPTDRNLISQYLLLYTSGGDPQDFDNMVDNDYHKAVIWTYLKTDSTAYAQSLYEKAQQVIAKDFPPGVNVRIGGGLPQTVAINSSLTTTKIRNILQMAVVVFLLSTLALGSPVGGLMVVIPLITIVIANLGIMGWLGIPLDMGTATTTAMVTGIGADYEIYMLFRLREEYLRRGDLTAALVASLKTSGKAVLFVALSIAGGYSALLVSDFRFYPRLGMTMITTMMISAVLSLLFLRAVIAVIKPRFIVGDQGGAKRVHKLATEGAR